MNNPLVLAAGLIIAPLIAVLVFLIGLWKGSWFFAGIGLFGFWLMMELLERPWDDDAGR